MIGTTVGHYRIVGRLGAGGMGVVYRALDERLDREVAIKCIAPGAEASPESRRRLLQEARAASALDHRNICTVHTIEESEDGELFVVMAYYRGVTLKERLRHGRLAMGEAVDVARQITAGLIAAHRRGIVHRDIKPGNVLITEEGETKILDFGLARVAEATHLTQHGAAIGTLAYMAPEQIAGGDVDQRADLWSLGVTLYEAVTGRLPFPAANTGTLVHAILNRDPDLGAPSVPEPLRAIIAKALAKDRELRYATAAELAAALDALAEGVAGIPATATEIEDSVATVTFDNRPALAATARPDTAPAAPAAPCGPHRR